MAKYSLDPENKRTYAARVKEWTREAETHNTVAKPVDSGIMAADKSGEVADVQKLCDLDRSKLKTVFPDLSSEEVVLTDERLGHIQERHPDNLEAFKKFGALTIREPDIMLLDSKNAETVMYIRAIERTNLNVIIRLALSSDAGKKHSVMTAYCLGERGSSRRIKLFTPENNPAIISVG